VAPSTRAGSDAVFFVHRPPRPPLDQFVDAVWICHQPGRPHMLERVLPSGASQFIINLKEDQTRLYDPTRGYRCITTSGSVLTGAHSRYQVIDTSEQEHVVGVAFKPGGTVAFLRVPAHETADCDVPLEDLLGRRRAATLRERLLDSHGPEQALDRLEGSLREIFAPTGIHPAVNYALNTFNRAPEIASVAAVTNAIGLSAKRFIERFKRDVGLTPKRYCRVRRFQRALASAHRLAAADWARVALECGYFDQAHFIHDFKSFAGVTPAAYQAARTPFQNHVKILQSDSVAV
jgi:AraC-like DNA-binding protein